MHGRRTRRVWRPNVQWVKLWSDALERKLRLKVTTAALAVIDKRGGLDQYLLQTKPALLGRGKAMQLRELVRTTMKERQVRGEPVTWLESLASERDDTGASEAADGGDSTTVEDHEAVIKDFELPHEPEAEAERR